MRIVYDKYYQKKNLFGAPYSALIEFYSSLEAKGKLLDLGCGQGRNSIALAKLGFDVMGIDHSQVGIEQLTMVALKEQLPIKTKVEDLYTFTQFDDFDFILLDSIFHFNKKGKDKEIRFIENLFKAAKPNTLITICIQKTGNKLEILETIIASFPTVETLHRKALINENYDSSTNHCSKTNYEMLTLKKSV